MAITKWQLPKSASTKIITCYIEQNTTTPTTGHMAQTLNEMMHNSNYNALGTHFEWKDEITKTMIHMAHTLNGKMTSLKL